MKRILFIIASIALFAACNGTHDETIETYADGTPKLVYTLKGKDNIKIAEKRYYSNQQLHSDIHFKGADELIDGTAKYYYPEGQLFAEADFTDGKSTGVKLYHSKGDAFHNGKSDSTTLILSDLNLPAVVRYHIADSVKEYRFYEDCKLQAVGQYYQLMQTGKWQFFYPNGNIQLEALYIEDKENGVYCSYRENGVPYFRGFYINGQRAGIWEFYDAQGNLSGRKDFDK